MGWKTYECIRVLLLAHSLFGEALVILMSHKTPANRTPIRPKLQASR
jgi:hypothetical protein